MTKSARTKATDISQKVRAKVFERDEECCITCGSGYQVAPNSHIVRRSKRGLGIEQNVCTMCDTCHTAWDHYKDREQMLAKITEYMLSHYEGWDFYDENLRFKKGM
jgi:Na+-translocating ferredoxin:NAD+ oxidoreductase RNF subunit RnfB